MTQTQNFRQILAIPGVRRLWIGQLVSIAGDFLAIFAVLSIASFRLHGTPAQITGVTISYMLPLAIFGPFAGVFVDRWNPRYTMIASDLTRAALVLLLLFSTRLTGIYAVLFAISTVSTFFIPAQSVLIRTLVPREGLLAANAIMQQAVLAIRLVSPAVAGLLVARFGPRSCFALDTVTFLFSAVMLTTLPCRGHSRLPRQDSSRGLVTDLTQGIRFILTHSTLAFVMLAMAAATFAISCFSPLIAIFVRDLLHEDVRVFGAISAAIGLGMMAGTQTARRAAQNLPPRSLVIASMAVIAAGITLMGAATLAVPTAIGAFVMGAGVGLLMVPAQTLIQSETPLPLVGRVSSGVMSLISLAQILGLLISGISAAALGLRPLLFSSAALLATLAFAGYCRRLRECIHAQDRRQNRILARHNLSAFPRQG